MKALVLLAAVVVSVFAGKCTHANYENWTEDKVMTTLTRDLDGNGDGVITELDLAFNFVLKYDHNFQNGIELHEFVKQWREEYHDEAAFAEHIFRHLDMDNSGGLDSTDVKPLIERVDTDKDGAISTDEFETYLKLIYQAC